MSSSENNQENQSNHTVSNNTVINKAPTITTRIKFPNIDMSLDLFVSTIYSVPYSLTNLIKLLDVIKYYELAGFYDCVTGGFVIIPELSYYNKDVKKPFSNLNIKYPVIWHSSFQD